MFVASLFVGVPATLYLANREEARRRWRPRPMETVAVGDGGYRGAEVTRREALGPPAHVHLTAVMCWGLGMAFVPGLLAGLYGLFFLWVGLVSVPGLVLAVRLLRLGGPLLRGEAEAAPRARSAARFARVLNDVVLGLLAAITIAYAPWRPRVGDPRVPWVLGGLRLDRALRGDLAAARAAARALRGVGRGRVAGAAGRGHRGARRGHRVARGGRRPGRRRLRARPPTRGMKVAEQTSGTPPHDPRRVEHVFRWSGTRVPL